MRPILLLLFLSFASPVHAVDTCQAIFGTFDSGVVLSADNPIGRVLGVLKVDRNSREFDFLSTSIYRGIAQRITDYPSYAVQEYGSRTYTDVEIKESDPDDLLADIVYLTTEKSRARDQRALALLNILKSMGPGFEQLIVDPGLLQRLDKFVEFVRQNPGHSPWTARDRFASSLPKVRVYRAMALNEPEANYVSSKGINSNLMRKFSQRTADVAIAGAVAVGRRSTIRLHESMGMNEMSPFISVTAYPELAASVAQRFASESGKPVRLYEIVISVLDLVSVDRENGLWDPGVNSSGNGRIEISSDDQQVRSVPIDRGVESFVFLFIPPQFIREVPVPRGAHHVFVR